MFAKVNKNKHIIYEFFIIIYILSFIILLSINNSPKFKSFHYNNLIYKSGLSSYSINGHYTAENITDAVLSLNLSSHYFKKTMDYIDLNTENWNFTGTSLFFSNIHNNETVSIEQSSSGSGKEILNKFGISEIWAQQFILPSNHCQILNLSLFIGHIGVYNLWIEIFNSTPGSGLADPIPDSKIASSDQYYISTDNTINEWLTFNFSQQIILNSSDTSNNSFYLILTGNPIEGPKRSVIWYYNNDLPGDDYGNALFLNGLNWEWNAIDFMSIVSVKKIFYPSAINLSINYSKLSFMPVSDLSNPGIGTVSFSRFIPNSNISILIISSQTVYFNVYSNYNVINNTVAYTKFIAYRNSSIVKINISLQINLPSNSISPTLNLSLFKSWNVSSIFANSLPVDSPNWTRLDNFLIVNITQGHYLVKCVDHNYLGKIYLFIDDITPDFYYVHQNLTVNISTKFVSLLSNIHLQIINSSNFTVFKEYQNSENFMCSFTPFNITTNDYYLVNVNWFNGSSLGFNISSFYSVYHSNLSKISDNINISRPFVPGELVLLKTYFNNTDKNKPILNATSYISINMTSPTYYNVSNAYNGFYNITIYTDRLISKNYTFIVSVNMAGYAPSNFSVHFSIKSNYNASLNVSGYYGTSFINGSWWVKPDPYFSDTTHKIQIIYKNGTSPFDGIYPAAIYAYPNWTDAVWYGNPFDLSGKYDILIDTSGLHEGDIGRILIVATSSNFETKEIIVLFKITEIPENLLTFDVSGFENITVYEGQTVQIAASFIDKFHNTPIVFNNNWEGNISWSIPGTEANSSHIMNKLIYTYYDYIDLPSFNIQGGKSYNISITGVARKDYAKKTINITLNVINKEPTSLTIFNKSHFNPRIGYPLNIYSKLTFSNGTILKNRILQFNISLWSNSTLVSYSESLILTNSSGIANYYLSQIPDHVDFIKINASFKGTETIASVNSTLTLPILPKFEAILKLSALYDELRVGNSIQFNVNLTSPELGTLQSQEINFKLFYIHENFTNITSYKEFTDDSGIATLIISQIQDGTLRINLNISYFGTSSIQHVSLNQSFLILPKFTPSLNLLSPLPSSIIVGGTLQLLLKLKINSTNTPISDATILVTLIFDSPQTPPLTISTITDINGTSQVNIKIPDSVSNSNYFTVSIFYNGDLSISNISLNLISTIEVLTPFKIFLKSLPIILITLLSIVSITLVYQYAIRLPKIKNKNRRIKNLYQQYSDLNNIKHIMVIEQSTGSSIYNYSFGSRKFDPDLIAGFLTAILSFKDSSKIKDTSHLTSSPGFELSYANFKIFLNSGNFINTALILDHNPSDNLKSKLNDFIQTFEHTFHSELSSYSGHIKPFKAADKLVEQIFKTDLLLPHRTNKSSPDLIKSLNDLQNTIFSIASTIEKSQKFFYISDLINNATEVRNDSPPNILFAINQLRAKNLFYKFQISELDQIISKEKLSKPLSILSNAIQKSSQTPPELSGIPLKLLKALNNHLKNCSILFQINTLDSIQNTPHSKRSSFVNSLLNQWDRLFKERNLLLIKSEKFISSNNYFDAIKSLDSVRDINEQLGLELEATKISNEIFTLMEKLKKLDPDLFEKLLSTFKSQISELNKSVEQLIIDNKHEFAASIYRKISRLAIQMCDPETSKSFKNAADELIKSINKF
ncbi:MAG: hypothetical protein ACTSWG_14025 [Candidatus Helarchaeota archaeon]